MYKKILEKKCYDCASVKPIDSFVNAYSKKCLECTELAAVERKCSQCKTVKPVSEFAKSSTRSGYQGYCRSCQSANSSKYEARRSQEKRRERAKKDWQRRKNDPQYWERHNSWLAENEDRVKSLGKEYRKKNRVFLLTARANQNAKNKNVYGTLERQDWKFILEYCDFTCLSCENKTEDFHIDHVISMFNGGTNTIDNIQPLCGYCNLKKGRRNYDFRSKDFVGAVRENCVGEFLG
jgi:hypothetical protein